MPSQKAEVKDHISTVATLPMTAKQREAFERIRKTIEALADDDWAVVCDRLNEHFFSKSPEERESSTTT